MPSFDFQVISSCCAEREAAHLRIRIGQLPPRRAGAGVGDRVNGEQRRRRRAVGVVDQQRAGVLVLIDRHARLFFGERPHGVVAHVERHELVGRLDALVEVDRAAVLGPEADADVAVERVAELAERLAAIGDGAHVDAVVGHPVGVEVVGRGERHLPGIGREAEAALADFGVVGQPLDRAGGGFEQIQVAVDVLGGDAALVAVGDESAEADPLAVVGDRRSRPPSRCRRR